MTKYEVYQLDFPLFRDCCVSPYPFFLLQPTATPSPGLFCAPYEFQSQSRALLSYRGLEPLFNTVISGRPFPGFRGELVTKGDLFSGPDRPGRPGPFPPQGPSVPPWLSTLANSFLKGFTFSLLLAKTFPPRPPWRTMTSDGDAAAHNDSPPPPPFSTRPQLHAGFET